MKDSSRHRAKAITRHYLWLDGRAWRLTHRLHTGIVSGEVRFPNFANTHQRLLAATASHVGQTRKLEIQGTTYAFDEDGRLDIVDQTEAAQDIVGVNRSQSNVTDVRRLLGARRWRREHQWEPPGEAIRQVEADLWPEKRMGALKGAPVLRAPDTI